jgi:alkylhydroperoxidase family enzyme
VKTGNLPVRLGGGTLFANSAGGSLGLQGAPANGSAEGLSPFMKRPIPMLSQADLPPDLAAILNPRVERLGYLGDFFRCAAHQPKALISFMQFTEDLKQALPNNLTEVVALSVARLMKNQYESVQHERLSLKLGFSETWVRGVLSLRAHKNGNLSRPEAAVQRLVIAVIGRRGRSTGRELQEVVRVIGPQGAIAVLMMIGRYVTHALIVNSLALKPPVPSPLRKRIKKRKR